MRGRFIFFIILLGSVMMLSSCVKTIQGPADELQMYSWSGETENGTIVSLTFDGSDADLIIDNAEKTLQISGLCIVNDDSLIICDKFSCANYTFCYKLHGDKAELIYNGNTLTLNRNKEE